MRFWDSSALVPLAWNEGGTRAVRALQERDSDLTLWWGTQLECFATVARLLREGRLNDVDAAAVRQRLEALMQAADQVEPTDELRDRAERLLAVHPLTAGVALQLAAALIWARERPARLGFVCLDEQLRRAAGREGFNILPADRSLAR